MKNTFLLFIVSFLYCYSYSQDTSKNNLDEVIIYSNKFAENKKNVVQKIDIVTQQRIAHFNAQNTGDLLTNTGNIFVQKSQQGGSSPIIRGFEASRVLIVVDGIKLNNAIYRSGHLQNVITVDQNMLERVEILYGPASTLYGSDALGGVVHFRTKTPKLSLSENLYTTGSSFARYSSANNEKTLHFDLSIGSKKLAWLQSYNFSDFGDMKMGSRYPAAYPNFGRRSQYIAIINSVDTILNNPDDRVQKFSGYKQWDITQKLLFKQNNKVNHHLNLQYSSSSNIPRYDRLQDVRNGNLRFAEWYYGPQERQLVAYEVNVSDLAFLSDFKTIISYQHIEESRHQREYKRYDRQDNRFENVNVLAATIDARKLWQQHEITMGVDAQMNDVKSTAFRKNILTGAQTKLDTRYPNGENQMNFAGIYAQHIYKFNKGKIVLNDGLRIQSSSLNSTIADNSFFNFPFTSIKQKNTAITGNIGLVFMPHEKLRINTGIATGFRSPNIDDLSKIFESNTASRQVIIPNPSIKPEYTYTYDLGVNTSILKNLQVDISGFYTWFNNAIALAPFQLNGEDSILYNGIRSRVFANQNINKAYLFGFNTSVAIDLTSSLKFTSTFNYTRGRLRQNNMFEVPLDHIPPVYGKTGFLYNRNKFSFELYSLYNGWKRIKDYHPSGEDNAQYATPEGTPSWVTINYKSTFKINENLSFQFGVENILDRNYRPFASGFSAPGRNFSFALRANH